jgi:hypothetical protein
MANPNYPSIANLEQTAEYRPGVASRLINVLTGGIAGAVTGSTQMAQEAQAARRALLQEELSKRDEERMMGRQIMIEALRSGVEPPTGGSLEEMMADLRAKKLKQNIIASEGTRFGLGAYGPSQYAANPVYQAAASAAQTEFERRGAELRQTRDVEAEKNRQFLLGLNVPVPENANAGQLEALRRAQDIKMQAGYPMQLRQESEKGAVIDLFYSNPELPAFKGLDEQSIQNLSPGSYKGLGARANKELQTSVSERNKLAQENAVVEATKILSGPAETRDPKRLYQLSPYLPDYIIKSPKFQSATQTGPGPTSDELKEIKGYNDSLVNANRVSSLMAKVAATPGGLKKFASNNFGYIADQLNTKGSKFFANDDERELARALKAEYESFIQGPRKTLFGASLTAGEQQSAASSWGSMADKDFFNRAVQFIDRLHEQDPIGFYIDAGKSINPQLIERVAGLKKNYQEVRPKLGVGQFGAFTPAGGGTAPAGTRVINMDRSGNRIK